MASIYRRGKTWWGRYKTPDGERRRVSLGTARKSEAEDLLAEIVKGAREVRLGIGTGRTNHKPLAPIISAFMRDRAKSLQDSTVRLYRLSLAHVLPGALGFEFVSAGPLDSEASLRSLLAALGDRRVSDITGAAVSAWRGRRAEQVSPRTATIEAGTLKTILGWAEDLGEIAENPLRGVKPLSSKGGRQRRAMRREEVDALVAVSPRHLALTWRMLTSTGLRATEFCNLTWGDVDLSRRLAFVRKTKTGEPRTVPISRALAEDLATWRDERGRDGQPVDQGDPVFVNLNGARWERMGLRKRFLSCARAAGLDLDDLTLHSTRHTFVSLALDAGMPVARVRGISGHKTLAMLAHYAHRVSDGHEVAEVLDGAPNGTQSEHNPLRRRA